MRFTKIIVTCAIAFALVFSVSGPAQAKDKFEVLKKMDREFIMALTGAVAKQYPGLEPIQSRVSTGDCPGTCNDSTLGGMCYCSPDSEGNCGDGETKTTRGGKPACKIKPTTASVIFNGREEPARVLGVNDF